MSAVASPKEPVMDSLERPSMPTPIPVPTSQSYNESPWGQEQASGSRRGSLAAPPGIPHPVKPPKFDGVFPKITRAASVSFIPQMQKGEGLSEENYLRHLAAATAQLQGSGMGSRLRPEFWGAEERVRTSSWAGLPEAGFASQQDYIHALNEQFLPQRRMSFNPGFGLPAPRGRNMSVAGPMSAFRGSVFSAFDGDNANTSPDSGLGRSFGNPSRRGSYSSSTPAGQPGIPEGLAGFEPRFARRYSMAPQFGSDWDYEDYLSSQMETLAMENYAALLNRRHSVAASAFPVRRPSPPNSVDSLDNNNKSLHTLAESEDDETSQFKLELNDNRPSFSHQRYSERYYVVEFKSGRTDVYYIPIDSPVNVKIGDLVIVEADRGKDLGKIIQENISPTQLADIQQEQRLKAGDTPRNLDPKKIFRHAQPNEVSLLVTKCQDEARSLQLCQAKIRQHNLPMEVVDAEYQWDRRKLTFFFIADERVDFRELVKDLFKMYKTRIWMCAVTK
ncbi:hypothetical protein DSO57_1011074 [Entomophthora muscae]|uniref:Uncharacterized protein n=1 Tax=Entomophthora muscae TaxID=34485 RepID=A0ACC2TU56_9FUNG|nr:hypothetical protein DSO57_1011074 [Entomophthora muscae]